MSRRRLERLKQAKTTALSARLPRPRTPNDAIDVHRHRHDRRRLAGSLRQAILDSNATTGPNTIDFNIGSGAQTILLLSALPGITVPVSIDGTSQPGYSAAPLIELDGNGLSGSGLSLLAGSSGTTIAALTINNFGANSATDAEIAIASSDNLIENCYLGTNARAPRPLAVARKRPHRYRSQQFDRRNCAWNGQPHLRQPGRYRQC